MATSFALSSTLCLSLSLLTIGCPKPPPKPLAPPAAVCQKWNADELTGWRILRVMSDRLRAMGEEPEVQAALRQIGLMLHRCDIVRAD